MSAVIDKAEAKGLDKMFDRGITVYDMVKLFTIASSELLYIISITVNKDEQEIRNLSMEDGVKLALVIYNQNKETIKNALAPLLMMDKDGEEENEKNNQ